MLVLPGDAGILLWGSGCPATLCTTLKTSLTGSTVAATTQEGLLENRAGVVEGDRRGALGLPEASTDARKVWIGWIEVLVANSSCESNSLVSYHLVPCCSPACTAGHEHVGALKVQTAFNSPDLPQLGLPPTPLPTSLLRAFSCYLCIAVGEMVSDSVSWMDLGPLL